MKVIIVGAGGATRELLRRLGELWEVVVVDVDAGRLEELRDVRPVETRVGDGSSAIVLERAGLEEADALVAAAHDDDVNLEAIRLASAAGLLRVIGIAAEPERVADYRAAGADVVSPDERAARFIELHLEPRRVVSTAFAEGKAEAIEFWISPDSTVRDKRLADLHSETWIVAAVLRDGELIVPHGDTELRAGDRVTVVGAASDYATIVRTFTAGESRFPLNFGRKVAVALTTEADVDGPVAEALNLVRNSQAEGLLVVHRDPATVRDPSTGDEIGDLLDKLTARVEGVDVELVPVRGPGKELVLRATEESVGLVVVPAPAAGTLIGRFRCARTVNTYGAAGLPLLLSRGTHPYGSIVVPARRTPAGEAAGRAGIDLARSSGATLVGVAAVAPAFVGEDDLDDARRAAAWLREEAAVQGVTVRRRIRRGNPVRIMEELAAEAGLLVLAMPDLPMNPFVPGVVGHLVQRVSCSVLLVPARS